MYTLIWEKLDYSTIKAKNNNEVKLYLKYLYLIHSPLQKLCLSGSACFLAYGWVGSVGSIGSEERGGGFLRLTKVSEPCLSYQA